jgi:DmsE family decaheme c-type cytochrome
VHGSLGPSLMTKNTVNQLCYDCHTEKRGPFRFAHPPVEENCLTCHNAHGANSTALLTMNLRNTCQACHSYRHHANPLTENNTSRGTAFMARQSCLNCHGDIHGSNQDYHFR